ncbi:MAG: hypothetical protein ACREFD_00425 [Stellaceae bacterium]
MGRFFLIALGLLAVAVAAGAGYFAISDIPPPKGTIVHTIPPSRLPH